MIDSKNGPWHSGYVGDTPDKVVAVVREVYPDWDGRNWDTVWACLKKMGEVPADFKTWTFSKIYQWFVANLPEILDKNRGQVSTHTMIRTQATCSPFYASPVSLTTFRVPVESLPEPSSAGEDELLKADDPRAAEFRDGDEWCDKNYAEKNGVTAQQIQKARRPQGLFGLRLSERHQAHAPFKPWVYRRAELEALESAIEANRTRVIPRKNTRKKIPK